MVTGAGSGIGQAVSRRLLQDGVAVVGFDLHKAKAGLDTTGLDFSGLFRHTLGNVTNARDLESAVHTAVSEFGGLDLAVNCAGVWQPPIKLADMSETTFEHVMSTNTTGVFLSMRAQIPALTKRGGGAIVNIASVAALKGTAMLSAYVASKHAVIGLTKSAALEYAPLGIRINAVCPGLTDTPMMAMASHEKKERMKTSIPLGRLGTQEDIAEAAFWLLSPAAAYCVGAALTADGGMMA